MSKNHISLLQEHMSKKKSLPNYVTISEKNGIQTNSFTIRVTCDNYTADGQGSSKKEAKLNAATKMCSLLKLKLNSIEFSPCKYNSISIDGSPLKKFRSLAMDANYIGKLQEDAAIRGRTEPKYICGDTTGPLHSQIFTITCIYNGFEETARANAKKEAKRLVAKKMFDRISVESEINLIGIQQLKNYDENVITMQTSAKRAENLFPLLSITTKVKKLTTDNRPSISEYHTFLRDAFEIDIREIVVDQLQDIITDCEKYSSSNFHFIGTHPLTKLRVTIEILNIALKEIKYNTNKEVYLYGLQLNTTPVISEVGFGPSAKAAEISAILQMAKAMSIMLL